MGTVIEYMDSFELVDSTRYISTMSGIDGGGNGRNASKSMQNNGGSTYTGVAVTPESTKTCAIAQKLTNAVGTGVRSGIMAFAENHSVASGDRHVTVVYDGTAAAVKVYRGPSNSGTLLGTSSTISLQAGAYFHYEVKVVIHDTTGSVEVRWEGNTILTLTNVDTRNGGTGLIDAVYIGGDEHGGGGTGFCFYDDWVIQNSTSTAFVGDVRVLYLAANAAGTYSSGTASSGTLVSCVDETTSTNGDSDYVSIDPTSLPKAISFNVANLASNVTAVLAVGATSEVRKDDAGANGGRLLLISGATESDGGSDVSVTSSYFYRGRVYNTDPNTSSAWTLSAVNALEVGWRRTL